MHENTSIYLAYLYEQPVGGAVLVAVASQDDERQLTRGNQQRENVTLTLVVVLGDLVVLIRQDLAA